MTWPSEYQRASADFMHFMVLARDAANVDTTHRAWTMVQGVLLAFRRRLTLEQALRFADELPPVLRAMFLERWHPVEPPQPFPTREAMLAEVRALRAEHNFSPPNAIEAVALALRTALGKDGFDRALQGLPEAARRFWLHHDGIDESQESTI